MAPRRRLAVGAVEGDELVVEEALVGGRRARRPRRRSRRSRARPRCARPCRRSARRRRAARRPRGRRCWRRSGRSARPARAREQLDLDLDGGVAPGVEDLAPDDLDDRAHACSSVSDVAPWPVATVADVTSEPNPTGRGLPLQPVRARLRRRPVPAVRASSAPTQPGAAEPARAWVLFRYDDCVRLLRDPTLSVEDTQRRRAPTPGPSSASRSSATAPQRGTRSILNLDPPDHTRIRGIVQKVFTPADDRAARARGCRSWSTRRSTPSSPRGGEHGRDRRPRVPAAVPGDLRDARHARRDRDAAARLGAHAHARPRARCWRRCTSTRSSTRPTT